jgi:hypothetical protein
MEYGILKANILSKFSSIPQRLVEQINESSKNYVELISTNGPIFCVDNSSQTTWHIPILTLIWTHVIILYEDNWR